MTEKQVLVVDDDLKLGELLTEYLETEGFGVEVVTDGQRGVERALSGDHLLIILDVMLPVFNGLEVLRRIRESSQVPVLMLTARGDEVDRIVGLEVGADDYLPKPFNPRELVARIRAILRRSELAPISPSPTASRPGELLLGDVSLSSSRRSVRKAGKSVELTALEFDLLEVLLRSAGKVMKREILAEQVLKRGFSPFDRSIDMHVSKLRRKLGPHPDGTERIKSVRSVGYLYTPPHPSSIG